MEKDLVAGAYLDTGARSRATAPAAMAMPDGCVSVEGARRQRQDGDAAVANHMTAAGGGVRAATTALVVAEAAHASCRGAAACAACSGAVVIAVGQRWWSTATRAAGAAASGLEAMFTEIAEPRRERDRLEASPRRQTGEDLQSGATREELDNLDQQLELTLGRVREMKDVLLSQQLDESHLKVHILKDQNIFLLHKVTEDGQQHGVAVEAADGSTTPTLLFGGFFPEVEEQLSTSLQLWPQQQLPDAQGFGLQPNLRLWL
ncbi:MADS-box transcription factor 29-like [Lolium perenne]|uniref:MADS-box transcription factor 29-like n=1 Tax=Lolium perenne TaxID=4522 RepID=UPI003A99CD5F